MSKFHMSLELYKASQYENSEIGEWWRILADI